jgi:hypothetical protein
MDREMERSDVVRIQYASKYAGVSNAWKRWDWRKYSASEELMQQDVRGKPKSGFAAGTVILDRKLNVMVI